MKRSISRYAVLIALFPLLLSFGCVAGGVSPLTPSPPPLNLTGPWLLSFANTGNQTPVSHVHANLVQANANVSAGTDPVAIFTFGNGLQASPGGSTCGGSSTISGVASGGVFTFTLTENPGFQPTSVANATATVSPDGTSLSGTWSTQPGFTCGVGYTGTTSGTSGTVTGIKVNPFGGTYSGTLSNGTVGVAETATVSQGQAGPYSVSVSGTYNGAAFTMSGSSIGAALLLGSGKPVTLCGVQYLNSSEVWDGQHIGNVGTPNDIGGFAVYTNGACGPFLGFLYKR